jgi:hypothetical protein
MAACSIDDCERTVNARGMCNSHYARWWKHGDPLAGRQAFENQEARFWAKVDRTTTPDGCWTWTAFRDTKGYGRITFSGGVVAHRFAWLLATGTEVPDGMMLDHICHNKSCVRADHLRVVNNKQNVENFSGLQRNNTSGVRGVTWCGVTQKWRAEVQHNNKRVPLGRFASIAEAEAAVVKKRLELFTHNDLDRTA